jgi:hypothetical protein
MMVRIDRNRMFVLGNGASIGAKRYPAPDKFHKIIPTADNFFRDLLVQGKNKRRSDFLHLLPFIHELLNDLIIRAWRIDPETQHFKETWAGINIEEVFSFFDVGEQMYSSNSYYRKIFHQAKDDLIKFIYLIILMRTQGQRCLFLEKLFSKIEPDDTIITFNWDALIDVTLEHLNNSHFKKYVSLFGDNFKASDYYAHGAFLKLHGSVNWGYCSNNKCKTYNKIQLLKGKGTLPLKKFSLGDSDKCDNCSSKLINNIIPPTSNKIRVQKDSFIHKQWLIARQRLRYSGTIIFIGYSFPKTDFYSEWLFRQINFLVDNDKQFIKKKIIIVNPEMEDKKSYVYQQYHKLFKSHDIESYRDLESFVAIY